MENNQVVCFGEMLWDVLPAGSKPGGAPMNVAYHLKKLGLAPAIISRVGADENGVRLVEILKASHIETKFIQKDETEKTGIVNATLNEKAEASYDIVFPVAWDFIAMREDLKNLVASAAYFVFGSLASRHDVSRETLFNLLEYANTKVLDINLRTPHFTKPFVETLLQHCDILKINDQELQLIACWYADLKKLEDQVALLQDRFLLQTIVVTCGSRGAILNSGGKNYTHPGFKVPVKDTVGSGDAFLAALLFKLYTKVQPAEALAFANGLGAFVATSAGACPQYDIDDVLHHIQAGFQ